MTDLLARFRQLDDSTTISDDTMALVLDLFANPDRATREKFLRCACRLHGAERVVAVLWLRDASTMTYTLASWYDTEGAAPPSFVREGCWVSYASGTSFTPSTSSVVTSWADQQKLLGPEHLISLPPDDPHPSPGYLHLLADQGGPDREGLLLRCLASALADFVERSRVKRQAAAFSRLRSSLIQYRRQHAKTARMPGYLEAAADVIRHATEAQACFFLVNRHHAGLHVAASSPVLPEALSLIASPGSVLARLAATSAGARLADVSDPAERERIFGTKSYDSALVSQIELLIRSPIRAIMIAPVADPTDPSHVWAMALVINQLSHARLGRRFSATDEAILNEACDYLGNLLVGVQTTHAMMRMSQITPTFLRGDHQLYEFVTDLIPGVVGMELCLAAPEATSGECRTYGGESWLGNVVLLPSTHPVPLDSAARATSRYYLVRAISGLEHWSATLRLSLRRDRLSAFEDLVLSFVTAWLGQALRSEQASRKEIDDMVQVRHAIRSGMAGLNYLNVIRDFYAIYRRYGDIAPLRSARFHKAIQWANLALVKTQTLLEESRLLLVDIRPETLQLMQHSVPDMVTDVLRTVRPMADRRELTLQFRNDSPRAVSHTAEVDRQLIEMLLFNLFDNAVKYSFRRRPVIVKLAVSDEWWALEVTDEGELIKPEDRDEIFLPFTRRPSGRSAMVRPGTGLGLAVALKIVKAHQGIITVDSQLVSSRRDESAARTTFFLKLPRRIPR